MTPDQLLTFATVAELGSISRAADALHLTQPAVSGQLKLLQDSFAQPLYRRVGRGIRLTATGEQLAALALQLRQTYERARDLRAALAGLKTGSLALGASTTPASYLLPYFIAEFRGAFPTIHVTLATGNTSDIIHQLSRFDLAFVEGAIPPDLPTHIQVYAWHRDEVVAVMRRDHPLAMRLQASALPYEVPDACASGLTTPPDPAAIQPPSMRSGFPAAAMHRLESRPVLAEVTLADIAQYPVVMREAGSGVRNQVVQAFHAAGLEPRVALELAGVEGVLEGARAGLGIAFVSIMAMRSSDPALCAFSVAPPYRLNRHISVLVPHAHALSAAAQEFLQRCLQRNRA